MASLSTIGAISTDISTKFELKNKKAQRSVDWKNESNYVVVCNGNLTKRIYLIND